MSKQLARDALVWGFVLWLIGYVLGILLFAVVPGELIGWVIMPIGIAVAVWILVTKVKGDSFQYYAVVGLAWLVIAILFDYVFLVLLFKPADGYYKLDVYIYYALTLLLPLAVGWRKQSAKK